MTCSGHTRFLVGPGFKRRISQDIPSNMPTFSQWHYPLTGDGVGFSNGRHWKLKDAAAAAGVKAM